MKNCVRLKTSAHVKHQKYAIFESVHLYGDLLKQLFKNTFEAVVSTVFSFEAQKSAFIIKSGPGQNTGPQDRLHIGFAANQIWISFNLYPIL